MSELDNVIDQIESHAALAREQKLRAELDDLKSANALLRGLISNRDAEIERLRGVLGIIACGGTKYDSAADLIGIARRALERKA